MTEARRRKQSHPPTTNLKRRNTSTNFGFYCKGQQRRIKQSKKDPPIATAPATFQRASQSLRWMNSHCTGWRANADYPLSAMAASYPFYVEGASGGADQGGESVQDGYKGPIMR